MSTIIEKEREYIEYILNHISNVRDAYFKYEDIFFNILNPSISKQQVKILIYKHDESKFSKEEFDPYRKKLFPSDEDSIISKLEFNYARLHHIHNNPHHPEYWTIANTSNIEYYEMPDEYIIEMICNWAAIMPTHENESISKWYKTNEYKLPLHHKTLNKVNKIFRTIDKFYNN